MGEEEEEKEERERTKRREEEKGREEEAEKERLRQRERERTFPNGRKLCLREEERTKSEKKRSKKLEILVLSPAQPYIPRMLINPMTMILDSQAGDQRQTLGHPVPIQTSQKQKRSQPIVIHPIETQPPPLLDIQLNLNLNLS